MGLVFRAAAKTGARPGGAGFRADRVVFINDVYFCARDVVRRGADPKTLEATPLDARPAPCRGVRAPEKPGACGMGLALDVHSEEQQRLPPLGAGQWKPCVEPCRACMHAVLATCAASGTPAVLRNERAGRTTPWWRPIKRARGVWQRWAALRPG